MPRRKIYLFALQLFYCLCRSTVLWFLSLPHSLLPLVWPRRHSRVSCIFTIQSCQNLLATCCRTLRNCVLFNHMSLIRLLFGLICPVRNTCCRFIGVAFCCCLRMILADNCNKSVFGHFFCNHVEQVDIPALVVPV